MTLIDVYEPRRYSFILLTQGAYMLCAENEVLFPLRYAELVLCCFCA